MPRKPRPEHVRNIKLGGEVKMERQNGEWRDREKVMCSLKREDSPQRASKTLVLVLVIDPELIATQREGGPQHLPATASTL